MKKHGEIINPNRNYRMNLTKNSSGWEIIRNHCINHKLSISVAESVTAGCLQTELSHIRDARDFFQGGITTYNCGQKARHLGIDPIFANTCNAVDQGIAIAMAKAVSRMFCSQIGLSVTGYATPEGSIKQPFAYFAIVYEEELLLSDKIIAATDDYGMGVQEEYTRKILEALSDKLEDGILVWK